MICCFIDLCWFSNKFNSEIVLHVYHHIHLHSIHVHWTIQYFICILYQGAYNIIISCYEECTHRFPLVQLFIHDIFSSLNNLVNLQYIMLNLFLWHRYHKDLVYEGLPDSKCTLNYKYYHNMPHFLYFICHTLTIPIFLFLLLLFVGWFSFIIYYIMFKRNGL